MPAYHCQIPPWKFERNLYIFDSHHHTKPIKYQTVRLTKDRNFKNKNKSEYEE